MRKLWLDDIRPVPDNTWEIAVDFNDAVWFCQEYGCPDFISFDHDLGLLSKTGNEFAHWLVNMDVDNPGFIPKDFDFQVHSANPVGAENIRGILNNYLAFRKNN